MTITAATRTPSWPGLASVPSGPRARIAAYVARQLVQQATQRVGVDLVSRSDHVDLDRPTLCCTGPTSSTPGSGATA